VDPVTGRRKASKGREPRTTLTANGRVGVARTRWHAPPGGSDAPVDRLLDAAATTASRGARELCCLLNAGAAGFARAADALRRTTGVRLSGELLRQIVEREGQHVLACRESGELAPAWGAADCRTTDANGQAAGQANGQAAGNGGASRIYLGCDGFTARLVTDAEKRRRRGGVRARRRARQRHGKTCRPLPRAKAGADQAFKEFKLVTFYDEPGAHRLVAVTRRDHHEAGRLMRRDGGRCGFFDAQQRPAVVDGAPWIANQIRRRSVPVTSVCLDFYHLAENVHRARRACYGEDDPAGHAWAGDVLHAAKHHGYAAVRDRLVRWRAVALRSAAKRRAADLLINYVTDRREMIRYPQFLERGLQIGSGPTEGQCKQVPRRVRTGGRRWDADNAEAVMALAAMHQSDLEQPYWKQCA
jgi:hypothetical protein